MFFSAANDLHCCCVSIDAGADAGVACILAALLQICCCPLPLGCGCSANSPLLAQPWQASGGGRKRPYGGGSPHMEVSSLVLSV